MTSEGVPAPNGPIYLAFTDAPNTYVCSFFANPKSTKLPFLIEDPLIWSPEKVETIWAQLII